MHPVMIAPSRDRFVRGGSPFFYCADTVWSAFTAAAEDEWNYYLAVRREQGYNALQINLLKQWEKAPDVRDGDRDPFRCGGDGTPDYNAFNEAYFDRAARMVAAAAVDVEIERDLSGYTLTAIDLQTRDTLNVCLCKGGGCSVIGMFERTGDVLVIGTKE